MENRNWRLPPQNELANTDEELGQLRHAIDDIDQEIAQLLNERLILSKHIGETKALSGRNVKDEKRERDVLQHVASVATDAGIAQAITNVYRTLLAESCAAQNHLIADTISAARLGAQSPSDSGATNTARTLYFPRVLLVGVGLIGGALARQIKIRVPNTVVVGCDTQNVLDEALNCGILDEGSIDLAAAIKKASLIVLCAPPQQNMQILKKIAPLVKKRQVIIDVTSTKSSICQLAQKLPMKAEFIGGHPLFGSHQQGLGHSANVAVEGTTFCVVPTKRSSDIALRRLNRWLGDLGLFVEQTTAQSHDETLALTSHLVQLLATTLGTILADESTTLKSKSKANLSGPALQGMARLMNSPASMWLDILRQNKTAVCHAIDQFTEELQDTKTLIANGAEDQLAEKFTTAARFANTLDAVRKP